MNIDELASKLAFDYLKGKVCPTLTEEEYFEYYLETFEKFKKIIKNQKIKKGNLFDIM